MMKSTELRLGNYVMLCFEHKPGWFKARVTEILNDKTINTDTEDNESKLGYYFEPIPLSPEWVKRAGFEMFRVEDNACIHEESGFKIWQNDETNHHWYHINNELHINIDFVHQLQNVIFVCTGTELEFKPNQEKSK